MTTLKDYNPRAAGIAWFREEDYPAAQGLFKPTNYLPPWEEWLERAEEFEKQFKAQGLIVERVYIDIDTFPVPSQWQANRFPSTDGFRRSSGRAQIRQKSKLRVGGPCATIPPQPNLGARAMPLKMKTPQVIFRGASRRTD